MLLQQPNIYGERLSLLNESFPSSMQKESRQIISLPVADQQPVITGGPAIGKFLQSNPVGALIRDDSLGYENYTTSVEFWLTDAEDVRVRDMGRVVDIGMVNISYLTAPDVLWWCTPGGSKMVEWTVDTEYSITARGRYFYFKKTGTAAIAVLVLVGFY